MKCPHALSHPGWWCECDFFWSDANLIIFPPLPKLVWPHIHITYMYITLYSTVWIFGGVDRWWNLPHFCHHCSSSFILCPKFLASQKEIFPKPYAYQWTDHGNSLFTQLCMKISGHSTCRWGQPGLELYSQKKLRQQSTS